MYSASMKMVGQAHTIIPFYTSTHHGRAVIRSGDLCSFFQYLQKSKGALYEWIHTHTDTSLPAWVDLVGWARPDPLMLTATTSS